jgi:hypothetical protein
MYLNYPLQSVQIKKFESHYSFLENKKYRWKEKKETAGKRRGRRENRRGGKRSSCRVGLSRKSL